jgi:hypothetical protein
MVEWSYIILNLGARWKCVVRFTPLPLYLRGNSHRYPPYRRLGGFQSRSGRYREEKSLFPLQGIEPIPESSSP